MFIPLVFYGLLRRFIAKLVYLRITDYNIVD